MKPAILRKYHSVAVPAAQPAAGRPERPRVASWALAAWCRITQREKPCQNKPWLQMELQLKEAK
jgi:hypothetical protein